MDRSSRFKGSQEVVEVIKHQATHWAARIQPPAYKQVMLELNAAALGSFAFVVIKTPIITRALREALQEKLG